MLVPYVGFLLFFPLLQCIRVNNVSIRMAICFANVFFSPFLFCLLVQQIESVAFSQTIFMFFLRSTTNHVKWPWGFVILFICSLKLFPIFPGCYFDFLSTISIWKISFRMT